jgi:hypothetical protein
MLSTRRRGGCDLHRGWKRAARGLTHVDVIIGMNRLLGAELAVKQFIGDWRSLRSDSCVPEPV